MAAYRSAQGKMVDMSQMVARNEKVRAVGNMNVNARGDIIDSHNRIIQDNTKRVKNSYQKAVEGEVQQRVGRRQPQPQPHTQHPQNIPIIEDTKPELLSAEKEFFDDDEDIIK